MKKILGIVVLGLLWCNTSIAQIINIDNKITLDFPKDHKYMQLREDDIFFGEHMSFVFEVLDDFEPEVFIVGPKNIINFIEDVRNGQDPMDNKYISLFMKKAEKQSQTASGHNYNKWFNSELKKIFKKAKIDFNSYILISGKKISDIDVSILDFDINDYQEMDRAELKQTTKEFRTIITEEAGDNKSILIGPLKIVIKKFKISKNEYNNLFMTGEAKFYFAINDDLAINGNFALFVTLKNDRAYAIFSECLFDCSKLGKKVDKMIKPMFSTNTSIDSSSTTKSTSSNESDLIEQLNSLNELYKSGALTKEEFEKAKKKILN